MCLHAPRCCQRVRLLGCCLDRCLVMELETVFLFIPPPAVTVVSGVCSLNSGPGDTWRTVKSTNPPSYAECCSSRTHPGFLPWKTKAEKDIQETRNLYLTLLLISFAQEDRNSISSWKNIKSRKAYFQMQPQLNNECKNSKVKHGELYFVNYRKKQK